jgi:uncharacterized membrane protein YdjX (TVP38/TMEM64 family)
MTTEPDQKTSADTLTRARLALLIAIPGVVLALLAAGITDLISLDELQAHQTELRAFVAEHRVTAALGFAAFYFAGIALSIPGWGLLTVAGGFLFGPVLGTIIVVLAASAGGIVVVLAARYILGDALRVRAAPAIRALEAGFRKNAFNYLLALRLMPVLPFFLVTLAVAFLGVHVRTFVAATVLGLIPVTAVYTTLGAGLGDALAAGAQDPLAAAREPALLGGLFGLAVLALLPVAYKRFRRR